MYYTLKRFLQGFYLLEVRVLLCPWGRYEIQELGIKNNLK